MGRSKSQSVISFDPISQSKKIGPIGRLLITRPSGGKKAIKSEPFGHYLFCGPQGSSKTSSVLWYAEKLARKYKRRRITYIDKETGQFKRFDSPPEIFLYSNFGVGYPMTKSEIYDTISNFDPYANEIRIVILDEIHTYFPKDGALDKDTKLLKSSLISIFSQLRKRNTFILSTAQVYGRLDKSLREQCLYMVSCKVNRRGRLINDFILGDDIIADDLGRWSGRPRFIYSHGLPKLDYDTKKVIKY